MINAVNTNTEIDVNYIQNKIPWQEGTYGYWVANINNIIIGFTPYDNVYFINNIKMKIEEAIKYINERI